MGMTRGNPLSELGEKQRLMRRMSEEAVARLEGPPVGDGDWMPHVGIFETDSTLVIEMDVPGVTKSQISLRIDGHLLTVEGARPEACREASTVCLRNERSYGRFTRTFMLSEALDSEAMQVACQSGVLKISLPKRT